MRALRRAGVVMALVAVAALGLAAAANAGFDRSPPPNPVERDVQGQIDALIAAGVPTDDPKIEMLRQQLAQLRTGDTADPPPEPGVNTAKILAGSTTTTAPPAAAATPEPAPAPGATTTTTGDWQSGKVQCEEVPGLLRAAELAHATCASIPQPDGTTRYVAVSPDGTVRVVLFGNDGQVRRLPDTHLPAPAPPGAAVTPTPQGDVKVTPPGKPPMVVDPH